MPILSTSSRLTSSLRRILVRTLACSASASLLDSTALSTRSDQKMRDWTIARSLKWERMQTGCSQASVDQLMPWTAIKISQEFGKHQGGEVYADERCSYSFPGQHGDSALIGDVLTQSLVSWLIDVASVPGVR